MGSPAEMHGISFAESRSDTVPVQLPNGAIAPCTEPVCAILGTVSSIVLILKISFKTQRCRAGLAVREFDPGCRWESLRSAGGYSFAEVGGRCDRRAQFPQLDLCSSP